MVVFETKNASQTQRLGYLFGQRLRRQSVSGGSAEFVSLYQFIDTIRPPARGGALVMGLVGELGSGKTVFVKGLAKGLGIREEITSPTYVFVRSYEFKSFELGRQTKNKFYHLDLYRLDGARSSSVLDSFRFSELVFDPSAIVVVEWSDRLNLKINSIKIEFDYDASGRSIRID